MFELKHFGKKEIKMLVHVKIIFSFSQNVFYSFKNKSYHIKDLHQGSPKQVLFFMDESKSLSCGKG